ncbi:phosphatase PAP2 family protein [Acinetobacter sp. MD2]|nr:phosphatase PAP2 family protein [Acinetobacter sp. MD2]
MMLYFIPVNGAIDHALSLPWVNASGQYTLKENHVLIEYGHQLLKNMVIAIALIHLGIVIASFIQPRLRTLRKIALTVLIMMLSSVAIIGVFKANSSHACPWDMVQLHQHVVAWDRTLLKQGACFPGGHASAGFALIALYFAYRDRFIQLSKWFLVIALVMGCIMSAVQMVRGAHFLSHNLWALWWSWAIDFYCYKWFMHTPLNLRIFSRFLPKAV